MKVPLIQPQQFFTGGMLDPNDLNAHYRYMQGVVDDVSSRRWQHSLLSLPFTEGVGTPYTNATDVEVRSYRLTCPVNTIVDGVFLSANMTSAGEVTVSFQGTQPDGSTIPWLTTGGAVLALVDANGNDTTDVNPDRVLLLKDVEYTIRVSSSGIFTLGRFDVQLILVTDRWNVAGTDIRPVVTPTIFSSLSAPNATLVAANNTALTTAAGLLAANLLAPAPLLFVKHGLIGGGSPTDPDICTFPLLAVDSARSQLRVVRMTVTAVMATTGGSTVTATLRNAATTTVATAVANVAGLLVATSPVANINVPLAVASAAASSSSSNDFNVQLSNASGTVNALKAYVTLWLSR